MEENLVQLSQEEFLLGVLAAGQRRYNRLYNPQRNHVDRYSHNSKDPWTMEVEGCLCEMAAAKRLGVYWSGEGGPGVRDVVGFEVRGTSHKNGHLIVHPTDDAEAKYMLVVGAVGRYRVCGWMLGKDAQNKELFWKEMERENWAYMVPQEALKAPS